MGWLLGLVDLGATKVTPFKPHVGDPIPEGAMWRHYNSTAHDYEWITQNRTDTVTGKPLVFRSYDLCLTWAIK